MIQIMLFLTFLIASALGFFIAHGLIIPLIEYYFLKNENRFLKIINKLKKENEELKQNIKD